MAPCSGARPCVFVPEQNGQVAALVAGEVQTKKISRKGAKVKTRTELKKDAKQISASSSSSCLKLSRGGVLAVDEFGGDFCLGDLCSLFFAPLRLCVRFSLFAPLHLLQRC